MRLRRSSCCASITIVCSLFPVVDASAASKPTVAGELKDLVAAGTLAPEDYEAHRATYSDAKATVKKLVGTRRAELNGVVTDLDDMAGRQQLTASRVPPLFLTLERNLQYWKTGPLLGYNQRVSFPGSELVFQHYAGHGIQIQWLATFGKLNGFWTGGKRYDTRAGKLPGEALGAGARPPPPAAAGGSRGSTCPRSTARSRRGSARSPRARDCRRWPAWPTSSTARPSSFPSSAKVWASSRPSRRPACAWRPTAARTTCSTPACRSCT